MSEIMGNATTKSVMNTKKFWEIIKKGREAADAHNGDFHECLDKMHESVKKQLKKLTPDEIYKWYEIFEKKEDDLYDADLWFITGGSDDGFAYCRRWIISKGEKVYNATKKNPKALPEVAPDYYGSSFEGLSWAAIDVYEELTGNSLYDYQHEQWQLKQLRKKKKSTDDDDESTWDKSDNIITQRLNRLLRDSENGDAESQYDLASTYAHGWSVDEDGKKAIFWLKKSAEQDFIKAQTRLAMCYTDGDYVKQNYTKALYWWNRAAEQDDIDAQKILAYIYRTGDGVKKNYVKALHWYKKAAEHGDTYAMSSIGFFYWNGKGVKRDRQLATKWYSVAANKGCNDSQYYLEEIMLDGKYIPEDEDKIDKLLSELLAAID